MKPATRLVHNGVALGRQPPVVLLIHQPPDTGKSEASCGHQATTCGVNPLPCPGCGFAFCDYHMKQHIRLRYVPRDLWRAWTRQYDDTVKKAAERAKNGRPVKLRVGRVALELE